MLSLQQLVFYFFSTIAVVSSIAVVAVQNSVRAVLFLVLSFFSMAALWLLLESEFLAIVLVLVYVGAVMVLFLFVVMMLDIEAEKPAKPSILHWVIGMVMAIVMLVLIGLAVGPQHFGLSQHPAPVAKVADYSNVKALGQILYQDFILPFEIAGVLLLVAMIAAIALTFRGARTTKTQQPSQQSLVRKQDRLKIISMRSETGEAP